MSAERKTRQAYAFILLGVILLGSGPMFVKFVNANGILVGFYRMFFASLMLSLLVLLGKPRPSGGERPQPQWGWAVLGGLVFALNISLWCSALKYTSASAVTLLDNTAPVWVGLLGWLFLKRSQNGLYWLGLLVTLAGAGLLIGWDALRSGSSQTTGNLIGLASGFSYALYILVTQRARLSLSSLQYSWMVALSGALALALAAVLTGLFRQPLPTRSLLLIFAMAFSSQVVAWLLVNQALGQLPAAGASVALVGQPVVTTILGIFLLNEVPSGLQLLGALICLGGILLAQRALQTAEAEIITE